MTRRYPLLLALLLTSAAAAQELPNGYLCAYEGPSGPAPAVTATPNLGPYGEHRALVVLVRFRDDVVDDTLNFTGWPVSAVQTPAFAYGLLDTSDAPATFRDSTLTRYYYEQSVQPNGDALVFYGDVYPEVIVTDTVETAYYRYDLSGCTAGGCPSQVGGYGFLTQEVLDRIDASGFDFSQYDRNADGKIDYVYVMVRGTPRLSEARGLLRLRHGNSE